MSDDIGAKAALDSLRDALPAFLKRGAPFGTELWQWLVVPVLVALSWLLALGLAALATLVAKRLVVRSGGKWDEELVRRLRGPVRLLFLAVACWLWVPAVPMSVRLESWVTLFAQVGLGLAFYWALFRTITVTAQQVSGSGWARARPGSRALISLVARVTRFGLLAAGIVTVLSALGYPVASLIAGLGLGGLAFALAAQKTVENLFGAFAIAVDQPFREGDFVKVDDFSGTVEAIGMRSTRFRTVDRTVITVPNGKLADSRVESFAVRDRIRLACTVSLVYGTTAAQVRQVLEGIEGALRGQAKLASDPIVVKLKELGQSSLEIEVMAWFATPDFSEFQKIRQELLLTFMEIVEKAGSRLAFPTQTVHLVQPRN